MGAESPHAAPGLPHPRSRQRLPSPAHRHLVATPSDGQNLGDRRDSWSEIGEITSSFQTFAVRDKSPLLDVKLVWEGGKPEFYEMTTFHQELPEEPAKPAPNTSKGDEPASVVEVPEYTGGVNGVEAAVHEVPEYTEAIGTAGDGVTPVVEALEFKGGVNAVEAATHEVPEYTEAIEKADKLPAPVVEVPDFKGGVNGTEAAVHEVSEYEGTASHQATPTEENLKDSVDKVDGDKMSSGNSDVETTVEKSDEFASASVKTDQAQKQEQPQTSLAKVKDQLPATGGEESATLALLGGLGLVLSAVFVKKGKKD